MELKEAVEIIEKLATTSAIFAAGVWAYFNFIKGRIYKPRLQPEVAGSIVVDDGQVYINAISKITNVGNAVVELQQKGTGLRILGHERDDTVTTISSIDWKHLATFPVFEKHGWIEGKETISHEQLMVSQIKKYRAFCLELRVVSKNISWTHSTIITLVTPE